MRLSSLLYTKIKINTGTTKRPRQAEPAAPITTKVWTPPEWIVQALAQLGDTHLLNEDKPTHEPRSGSARSSTETPPTEVINSTTRKRKTRTGSDTLSLTQAVEAYCDSTLDSDEEPLEAPEDAPIPEEAYEPPSELVFSGLYQGHVTMGKNGMYFGIGTTDSGQSYVDIGSDPNEDSSWFDDMLKPLEHTDVPPTTLCRAPTGALLGRGEKLRRERWMGRAN